MPINQTFEEGRPTKNRVYKDSCLPRFVFSSSLIATGFFVDKK